MIKGIIEDLVLIEFKKLSELDKVKFISSLNYNEILIFKNLLVRYALNKKWIIHKYLN